jgi:ubiquinone biosynthesis protein COQ9
MDSLKNKFLDRFIISALDEGINESTLTAVSREIYGDTGGYVIDFYNGLSDVIFSIEERYDAELYNNNEIQNIKSTTEKVKHLLISRIKKANADYYIRKELISFYSTIQGAPLFLKTSWASSDKIWKLAGDTSLDINYYSKRTLLLYIYTNAKKFYAQTEDEDFSKTTLNIEKNLERIKIFNKLKTSLKRENIPFVRLFK